MAGYLLQIELPIKNTPLSVGTRLKVTKARSPYRGVFSCFGGGLQLQVVSPVVPQEYDDTDQAQDYEEHQHEEEVQLERDDEVSGRRIIKLLVSE